MATRSRTSRSSRESELRTLIERWRAFDTSDQLACARVVASRRARQFARKYPNVISVGVGWRTVEKRRKIVREVSLRFLVARKWDPGTKRERPGRIPDAISTTVRTLRGKRVRCAIPTDVDVLGEGRPSGTLDLTAGVRAAAGNGSGAIHGSSCCLVRKRGTQKRFLLGCHHVFARSLNHGNCTPQQDTVVSDVGTGLRIGPLFDWASLGSASTFGYDAALVSIDDATIDDVLLWGNKATRVADPFELPEDFKIYVRRRPGATTPLSAHFVSEQFGLTLAYQCGRKVRVRSAYESIAATEPGDSGAPLIGIDGTLYGMHFWETNQHRSLAVPASDLFDEDLFSIRIELA